MSARKIVIVEDDFDLLALLRYNLEKQGFQVATWQTGQGAVEFCRRERPDLAVLDIMLPEVDGLEICRRLRALPEMARMPIIFLTARASELDRVLGLEIGANDYIVKPFSVQELLARIKVQLRTPLPAPRVLKSGDLELDPARCQVRREGQPVTLTATEFRLLEFLMTHPGLVFSRDQLLDAVWGLNRAVTGRTVDVYILRLRQKLEPDPTNPVRIRSVRGFGYCFEEPASATTI